MAQRTEGSNDRGVDRTRRHRLSVRGAGHPLAALIWLPRLLALAAIIALAFFAAGFIARGLALVMNWG